MIEESKEKISNLIFEKTEEAKDDIKNITEESDFSSKFLNELKEEREVSNKIMNELKDSIISLKEEISNMKQGEKIQEG